MKKIVVIGGMNIDILASANPLHLRDSSIGSIQTTYGGVGRNIAENIARLGINVSLCSVVGNDSFGDMIVDDAQRTGINTDLVQIIESKRTGSYLAVSDQQDMVLGVNDMDITSTMNVAWARNHLSTLKQFDIIVIEANLPEDTIQFLTQSLADKPIIIDLVSAVKAPRLNPSLSTIHTIKCNASELLALSKTSDILDGIKLLAQKGVKRIIVTQGKEQIIDYDSVTIQYHTPKRAAIVNVTGAGDAFTAGIVVGMALEFSNDHQITLAMKLSAITIQSATTVSSQITPSFLKEAV